METEKVIQPYFSSVHLKRQILLVIIVILST